MFCLNCVVSLRYFVVLYIFGWKFLVVGFGSGVEDVLLLLVFNGLEIFLLCFDSFIVNNVVKMM